MTAVQEKIPAASPAVSTNGSNGSGAHPADRTAAQAARRGRRKPLLIVLFCVVAIGSTVAALYAIHAAHFQETDDAYIEGHVITVSPQVSAMVKTVFVLDNQTVRKGEPIIQLDPTDYQLALDQAEANQVAMDGKLQQAKSDVIEAQAEVQEADANLAVAQANAENSAADYKRFTDLRAANPGAVSKQALDAANAAQLSNDATVKQAEAKLAAAKAQIATKQATVLAAEGDLKKAQADVHKAQVNLGYCTIGAPCDGKITRKSVEAGSYVQTGEQLLAIVPNDVWVVANYKETQLEHMKPGQTVSITVDAYPGEDFTGKVESIQSGTGSRFSMLPAENATGNYVKVVQRVPVKILLDSNDKPLSPGMSVVTSVDVR
jgi:membrane fusion protein (multidrug efflux system)